MHVAFGQILKTALYVFIVDKEILKRNTFVFAPIFYELNSKI